jgi:hypothetical protein
VHDEQPAAPARLMVPAPQSTHAAAEVAPLVGFAVPAGQSAHEAAPAELQEPGKHDEHKGAPALL